MMTIFSLSSPTSSSKHLGLVDDKDNREELISDSGKKEGGSKPLQFHLAWQGI